MFSSKEVKYFHGLESNHRKQEKRAHLRQHVQHDRKLLRRRRRASRGQLRGEQRRLREIRDQIMKYPRDQRSISNPDSPEGSRIKDRLMITGSLKDQRSRPNNSPEDRRSTNLLDLRRRAAVVLHRHRRLRIDIHLSGVFENNFYI